MPEIDAETAARNFERWFQGSSVVDATGKPLVLYHSSTVEIQAFDPSKTRDGGFHFGTQRQAESRAHFSQGEHVVTVHLSAERLMRAKDIGGFWRGTIELAKHKGYDGIVYLNRCEGVDDQARAAARSKGKGDASNLTDAQFRRIAPDAEDSFIVFRPTQIKSVLNSGAFDPTDPDIADRKAASARQAMAWLEAGQKKAGPRA